MSALLRAAQTEFPAYYAAATDHERVLMDDLVVSYARLLEEIKRTQLGLADDVRQKVEKDTVGVEETFMELRALVRVSAAFMGLSKDERAKIERILFQARAAWFA